MPATEQTWYNQKVLHVVFAVSALVMALATFWMMAKDHNREWKSWQLADRKKEAWTLAARRDVLADQSASRMTQLSADLRDARGKAISTALLEKFQALVREEDARLENLGAEFQAAEFGDLETVIEAHKIASHSDPEPGGGESTQASAQQTSAQQTSAQQDEAITAREKVFAALDQFIAEAKRREKLFVVEKKFVNADRTAAVSKLGLQVGGGASAKEQAKSQQQIDELDARLTELTGQIATASSYRTDLEGVLGEMDAESVALVKELDLMRTDLKRLDDQIYLNTSNVGEWITRWPVLDALYDGNVRIDQIWLPDLTINYNFSQVARFDRCKTCHRAISTTAAGTASDPDFPTIPANERDLILSLDTPGSKPNGESDADAALKSAYGLVLASEGAINYADVTVQFVVPESPASQAGFATGDILRSVAGTPIFERGQVEGLLLETAHWGAPLSITVRRGLDHPFTSHPRLDLYLTDMSPHSEKVFGCTVCHDGQGSGTDFKWSSHTPSNADQQEKWRNKHDWFDNHHWIFPMKPNRFVESNCMKCHYGKADLQASERFPDPPAPKLVEGWSLVEKFGCFGCHEINGFDGPLKRLGPDLRVEPNYHAVAAQIMQDDGLSEAERGWAEQLVRASGTSDARHALFAALKQDANLAISKGDEARLAESQLTGSRFTGATHNLADGLKDVEVPGQYRKAGPSLRYLRSKIDYSWLSSWINKPSDFRPTTRMPQFFHQHEHLQDDPDQLAITEKFEPIEVRALTEFLLASSNPFEYLTPPAEVTETPSAERGKWLFESRGCLACHSHQDFPDPTADQGPDLSRIGAKLNTEKGRNWLYSWIKEPHRYHARTKMPQLFLDPIAEKDATGQPTGVVTDPAADIAAFLLGVPTDWQPTGIPSRQMSAADVSALEELAIQWLASDKIPTARAKKFLQEGIPEHLSPTLKEAERLLIGINDENRVARQLEFVARQTIGKYGCFGCHDIPGFENAKSIGTALADWGRKETSKLAFGNIHKFLETHGLETDGVDIDPSEDDSHGAHAAEDGHAPDDEHAGHGHLDPMDFFDADSASPDKSYFIQSLNSHSRDGFLWQKLRMPRSYDYKTTKNKGYNERLRMPRFPLDDHQREAIATFVLGLVSEPPAEQFIYHPDARQKAIVEGRQVLDKFNCAGCHTLDMEQWELDFDEETFESPSKVVDFPFLSKHFSDKLVATSEKKDSRGMLHATLHGLPVMDETTGEAVRYDEDGLPLEDDDDESDPYYMFTLWRNALVNGEAWNVGVQDLLVPAKLDGYGPVGGTAHAARGGDLARYLFPRVIERVKQTNPQAKGAEAWGWLPPSLVGEGDKVQTDWLHGFLMDPFPIRPAVMMRMPNFHMDSSDAAKLANYFAASSGASFPYEYKRQQRASYLAMQEALSPQRMNEAMNIVTDGNYCVKCHAVADFQPQGELTTLGPNLANVYRRLRPEYVRNWIANPKGVLTYTGMPVNIPYQPESPHLGGISQDLFQGSSIQQVEGLVDLLMNFDIYTQRQTSIGLMVKPTAESAQTEEGNR